MTGHIVAEPLAWDYYANGPQSLRHDSVVELQRLTHAHQTWAICEFATICKHVIPERGGLVTESNKGNFSLALIKKESPSMKKIALMAALFAFASFANAQNAAQASAAASTPAASSPAAQTAAAPVQPKAVKKVHAKKVTAKKHAAKKAVAADASAAQSAASTPSK